MLSENYDHKKKLEIDDFEAKFKDIISQINNNAPVKIIHTNKNESEIVSMFNEIASEIKKIDLKKKNRISRR